MTPYNSLIELKDHFLNFIEKSEASTQILSLQKIINFFTVGMKIVKNRFFKNIEATI